MGEIGAMKSTVSAGVADNALLRISDLSLAYATPGGAFNEVVRGVDLTLRRGEVLGLVGESGCGKSTTALAAMGYRSPGVRVLGGQVWLGGTDLMSLPLAELRTIWGRKAAFVSQQANLALNPSLRIGQQIADPLRRHMGLRGAALLRRQIELLQRVEIPNPERAIRRYPFEFSGGQQQRIAIAVALSCEPELLILDEPTTGLDATTQAHISVLLGGLVREKGVSVIYVSHDLALLHSIADRIAVMYAGQIVEVGTARAVVTAALHPYTRALMLAAPSLERPGMVSGIPGRPPSSTVKDACAFADRCSQVRDACISADVPLTVSDGGHVVRCLQANERSAAASLLRPLSPAIAGEPVLAVRGLVCTHRNASAPTIRHIDLDLRRGETLGIVGESGSGKSTLLRAIAGLLPPTAGSIEFRGETLAATVSGRPRAQRGELQMVFQNPDSSLNPRHTVRAILSRPLRLFREGLGRSGETAEIERLLDAVQLPRLVLDRRPSELSGGQKQRIAIARAFAARPAVLLCDEITSALDVSVQASILELLGELAAQRGVATIFVSHDLAVVRMLASRTMVMRHGVVLESGPTAELFSAPRHDYTRTLLAAVHDLPRCEVPTQ